MLGVAGALALPALAVAAVELPHLFVAGDVISAAEMNANFKALTDELEALRGEVDALKEAQLEPIMKFDTGSTASLSAGDNFITPIAVSPNRDGQCHVSVTGISLASSTLDSGQVQVATALKTDAGVTKDVYIAGYLNPGEDVATSSVTHVYEVVADETYQFGCSGQATGDFVGTLFICRMTVICL
jgi:hypothetical protein